MKEQIGDIRIILILCLTIGLAPYYPEPHIFGKLFWVWGGGQGMGMMDWFDLLLHGFPWAMLAIWLIFFIKKQRQKNENSI